MKERLTKLIKEAQERYIYAEEQAQYLMDNDVDCDATHTLRLIYADLMARANRSRAKAEEYMISKPEAAVIHRGKAETYTSAASIVKIYCHNIGFDPSTKGEQNVSIRKESEDA